jgi:hypothetical protein
MKTRSSSGVNSKIDLEFNVDTLRITDCDQESDDNANSNSSTNNIASILKRTSTQDTESAPKIKAEVGTARLKSFLNDLSQEN